MVIFQQKRRIGRIYSFLTGVQLNLTQGLKSIWYSDIYNFLPPTIIHEEVVSSFSKIDRPDIFFFKSRWVFDFPNIEKSSHIISIHSDFRGDTHTLKFTSPYLALSSISKQMLGINKLSKEFFDMEHMQEALIYLNIHGFSIAEYIHPIYIK